MSEQIKETEIMIGHYISDIHSPKGFFKVTEVRKTTVRYGYDYKARYEDLRPIPLTEDILLKCGFKVSMNKTCYGMITESGKTRLSIFHDGLFKVSCEDLEIKVKYLHQLQNLFKALTQTDLKVEV